ncbi:trna-dihydrouridine synthase [Limosa lapponica baueri]|uniref:Trna-dihydrouridine synthase n=1 Tax=Limosa lapponica baueri TaxID=1758121 RepID=A0A2I0TR94_LIMLA|nr:trna-dihydrouridine synthase [Limosa lapponica baueri]
MCSMERKEIVRKSQAFKQVINSEVFEMADFYEETTAIFEAKKTSLETETQDEGDQTEDPDVIKMAVRFDKDKSKKLAEQAAAIVCLRTLGVPEGKLCEGESHLVNKRKREDRERLSNRDHGEDLAEPSHKKANFIEGTSDMNVPKMPR